MYHFFLSFFCNYKEPCTQKEESCLHHEPFFPELFFFIRKSERPLSAFNEKQPFPKKGLLMLPAQRFRDAVLAVIYRLFFFVSSAKTHAKYDSCASHAEHEIFCCFSHSITCICGRCFICRIAGSIIFVRSISRIGTIILSRIVSTRYLFRFKLRFLLRFLLRFFGFLLSAYCAYTIFIFMTRSCYRVSVINFVTNRTDIYRIKSKQSL